jgi:predicted membrane-bound spermidine synthase
MGRKKLHFAGGKELELAAIITGIGYMLIEIPVIVQLEMIIGFPIYTFALVLTILLVFSGLGSWYVEKIRSNRFFLKMVFVHPLIILGFFLYINYLRSWLLELPGILSLLVVLLPFSLLAFTAGMPFPILSRLTHQRNPDFFQVVFAWNGFMSVVASLLSHFTAIEYGIHFPYFLSIPLYGGFWVIVHFLNKSLHPIP